ncbi:hypothetical protein PG993_009973 [Apiospora rasikravindrae]|uniref:Major facilitator superfamily (MFS) profile domain-containing protein n=1 Tax=Apiospora rasikravindrae TaxID=990691 RepID=A0ABR1SKX1_9PEZI
MSKYLAATGFNAINIFRPKSESIRDILVPQVLRIMSSPDHQETLTAAAEEKPVDIMSSRAQDSAAYTVFSETAKRAVVWTASFAAMFSGLSSFIYYPALQPLATDLRVSLQLVNLTITSYLVVAGLAPSLIGDMADHAGRRPVYIVVLTFYFGANIGLALQDSYAALLVLRMVQSAGSSAYGVISDVTQAKDRGSYVGVLMGFTNVAPSLGPVLGGVLAEKAGWRWIFWLLTILSGLLLLCIILFFPETCQRIVGNGSVPATGYNRTVVSFLRPGSTKEESQDAEGQRRSMEKENSRKCHVLLDKGSFSTMFAGSMAYTLFGCLGASLSAHCIQIYKLNYLQAGLIYLPAGVGGILVASLIGRLLDHDYKLTARKHGVDADRGKEDNLDGFPIEEARLRSVWYLMALSILATIGYGWALDRKSIFSTLLSDLNPGYASTSQAAYNLVRCLLGAVGIAALEAMVDSVGLGWCFTIMGLILACTVPLLALLQAKGHQWRWRKANIGSERSA